MPAVSKKQFKKMFVLEREGKISPEKRHEFTDTVDYNDLPNRKSTPVRRARRKK